MLDDFCYKHHGGPAHTHRCRLAIATPLPTPCQTLHPRSLSASMVPPEILEKLREAQSDWTHAKHALGEELKGKGLAFLPTNSCIQYWETANLGSYFKDNNPMARTLHLQHVLAPEPLGRFLEMLAPALNSEQDLPAFNPEEIAQRRAERLAARQNESKDNANASSSGEGGSGSKSSEPRINFYATPSTSTGKTNRSHTTRRPDHSNDMALLLESMAENLKKKQQEYSHDSHKSDSRTGRTSDKRDRSHSHSEKGQNKKAHKKKKERSSSKSPARR